ncbi:MAG: crossover junction endodeoxyribonuclease RuvC [Acidobacteriota bacterium]|nr:crossover junction endodeoxyribonuclease RuvC [Acidobacteriota bacterium]MDW3229168.1 crossover junction endodeoxyribonuclease RuvC [Acidobacteriota bacterium]MDY0230935.1 crossover junction endodeoxyribonuclease RuvC [Candidatus Saccharicenans sp.]
MRVLGIDPSLQSTGFGIVENLGDDYQAIVYGIIKPKGQAAFHYRLNEIRTELEKIINQFKPDEVAIENPFYARNVRTAISLGQVRGAVMVALASRNCGIYEYSALEIKKAVTGYGQAQKDQVQRMVKVLLNLDDDQMPLDASDALAAAICHLNNQLLEIRLKESDK